MADRDARDAARAAAPLRAADDALTLDTSGVEPDAVFETAVAYVRQRLHLLER
jgi:cytidylate kinase